MITSFNITVYSEILTTVLPCLLLIRLLKNAKNIFFNVSQQPESIKVYQKSKMSFFYTYEYFKNFNNHILFTFKYKIKCVLIDRLNLFVVIEKS